MRGSLRRTWLVPPSKQHRGAMLTCLGFAVGEARPASLTSAHPSEGGRRRQRREAILPEMLIERERV